VSRAEELEAKVARIKAGTSAPADLRTSALTEVSHSADAEVSHSVEADLRRLPPRVKPVRLNVDVSPAVRAALRRLCAELEAELGGTPVSGQDVLRCLIQWPLGDDEAHGRLLRDLARSVGQ
jgi:hypothetical protein